MVLVYLPTKLGDFVRGNVGIHIPAPWVAYGTNIPRFNNRSLKWLDQSTSALPLSALESSHMRLHPKNISLVALIPYRKSEKQKKTWAIPYTWKNHLQMGVLIMFFFFSPWRFNLNVGWYFVGQDHGSGMWFSNPNHTGTQWDAIPKGIGRTCSVRVWCWCGLSLIELNIDTTHQAMEIQT